MNRFVATSVGPPDWKKPEHVLEAIAEKKRRKKFKSSRAFCATGEGGGIDNSCGANEKMAPDTGGGSGGGAKKPSSSSEISKKIAEIALDSIAKTGGFSIHPVTTSSPTTGYMVSVVPESETILNSKADITGDLIGKFLDENEAKFESRPSLHVGGWIDSETGKVYLDLSERFDDIDDAIDAAEKTDQLAIWDLNEKSEIRKEDYSARRTRKQEDRSVRLSAGNVGRPNRRGSPGSVRQGHGWEDSEGRSGAEEGREGLSSHSRGFVADVERRVGYMPKVSFRGTSIAAYSVDDDTIYVSPDIDPKQVAAIKESFDSGWFSQPNPVLHEYSHRYHYLCDPAGFDAACRKTLTEEQRSIIAEKVSGFAATGSAEFVAEYIAGRLSGQAYGSEVSSIVRHVTSGAVKL